LNGHLKSRPKGAKRLTLPISEALYQMLMTFKEKQAKVLQEYGLDNEQNYILLVLTTYNLCELGMPIDQHSLNDMIRSICKKIGVDNGGLHVSMYTCRHTVATKLANIPGMSYPWAAYRLGHSLKTFMKVYVHVDQDKNEDMLNIVSSRLVTQN
ncbi:MAG: site-specific integrase, partial [Lactobacillus sp.]|nr:site-specific integrase [Lactobacillus sp.]